MGITTAKSQWLSYSGQATNEWSGGVATFSNGDIATAFSVSKDNGASSVIVQRLNTNGIVVWSLDIDADYAPGAGSVLVGADDKVFVTGGTKKGASGESGKNDSDIFVSAISASGQKLWYKNYGIGIHEIGSTAILDANGNILLEGRVSEVNDAYSFIKDVPNFYGAEFSGGWRGFQLRINPLDGTVTKAYTTGSGNSGGGPIAIDRSRNIAFVSGYTFGAVNGVNTIGNGDPSGANTYLIARNETTGAILWTRMENWMRSNLVSQESENAIYFVDKGNLEKVNASTGQTIWSKALTNTNYVLSPIVSGGVLLSESESSGTLAIRRFDASGTENGSQVISHTGKLYPRSFVEQGDGILQIAGTTSGAITVPTGTTLTSPKQSGNDSFVLQVNSAFSIAPKVNTPLVRGNSLYTIVDGPSWTQAEANSVKLGGHLVTMNDANERRWLSQNIYGNQLHIKRLRDNAQVISELDGYFVGLNDRAANGIFQWAGGDVTKWSNPSEYIHPAYFADKGYLLNGFEYGAVHSNSDGLGPDIVFNLGDTHSYYVNDGISYRGIAETPFIRRGDSAYVIVQGPTWEEAEANAVKLGGHLVTINDAAENAWVYTTFAQGIAGGIWLGGTDKEQEGAWKWADGSPWSYSNFSPGQPDNHQVHNPGGGEDYLHFNSAHGSQWNDISNAYPDFPFKTQTGIAEIKIAPNITPTGTPTLSGNFQAGQVITIDRTPIQDADNFTGYTPDYKYSWEISTNGINWSKLTSVDATDNTTTYTLTTTEVGKQIRGVVSYLDGYGTNETVSSLATDLVTGANRAPTAITSSISAFNENIAAGSTVATLSSTDPDSGNTFSYALVSGTGSTDNAAFTISSNQLKINSCPDFETKSSYSIRVRTTDQGGLFFEKNLTFTVNNINEAPSRLTLSSNAFTENLSIGTTIATIESNDPDAGNTLAYALVSGAGSTDNAIFSISGNQLKINTSPNFESKKSYSVRLRATDQGGLFVDQSFVLGVTNVNEAPTSLTTSATSFNESIAVNTTVAILNSTDPDSGNTFTYSLVSGAGATDNLTFSISGNQLKINSVPDFETKSSYSIRVRSTDQGGLFFEKNLNFSVKNVNERPVEITTLAERVFNENIATGSTVSTLKTIDPDADNTFRYAFVTGTGSTDNGAFAIVGDKLNIRIQPDFETKSTFSIRVRSTDQGGQYVDNVLIFKVLDLIETVSSSVSTGLASDKDNLELTGTKNIFGTGNAKSNIIIGNSGRNRLTGGLGKDLLTGSAGSDTFFYGVRSESLIGAYDVITDYTAGESIVCGFEVEGDSIIAPRGTISALTENSVKSLLDATFDANTVDVFKVEGLSGCFVAINDANSGFQANTDSIIHLLNYNIDSTQPVMVL